MNLLTIWCPPAGYEYSQPSYLGFLLQSLLQLGTVMFLAFLMMLLLVQLYPFTLPKEFYPDGNIPKEGVRKKKKAIKWIFIIMMIFWIVFSLVFAYEEYTNIPDF